MSRFFSDKYSSLTPYTPGEQPKERKYIKLNTNESPYPPSPLAVKMAKDESERLNLYSDPEVRDLVAEAADVLGVKPDEILFTNGSDEILNFAFMAFCDEKNPAVFPDITYGFYKVFAELNGVPYTEIPLNDDYTVNVNDYIGVGKNIFLANPNAQTGIALPLSDIEAIVASNPDNIVVIDEAYVDFGGESAIELTKKYDNLLVTQTFSKSRSLAGARLGFGVGCAALMRDLNTVKYSTNPYNVNRMTMAAGIGALKDTDYFEHNCAAIKETRAWTTEELEKIGFSVLPSSSNFVFAKNKSADGAEIYKKLKENGILVRHFDGDRTSDYNRITIGAPDEMRALIAKLTEILEEI